VCGITGFFGDGRQPLERRRKILREMTAALARRGPDAEGYWESPDGFVHLGHRRLSIIDLTSTGAQPMTTSDGRYTLIFNGEIYNFAVLRAELLSLGREFLGTSDTEVLLAAMAEWGVIAALPKLNGMFAFALWDELESELWLARDRFGEKPLYFSWHEKTLIFGSELKALVRYPDFQREVDDEALALYARFNYVPQPYCIFKNAKKLPAAHYLRVRMGRESGSPEPYWSPRSIFEERGLLEIAPTDPALVDLIDVALRRAIALRMVADVPLGAFLSGGIDSSTVVALMQAQSNRPVKTFTIGFSLTSHNEAEDASRIAHHLGTEHLDHCLSSQECLDGIQRLPNIYDEPFADSSQIPTLLVSEFTRRYVTVALSGDAGDELFGGYNRYMWSSRVWPSMGWIPANLRVWAGRGLQKFSPAKWDRFFEFANAMLPTRLRVRDAGDKCSKLALAFGAQSPDELYRSFVSQWQDPKDVVLHGTEPELLKRRFAEVPKKLSYVERMMYLDLVTYLPDDILCKVDRASMSVGLEARVPFLDNELVDLAWRLPLGAKICNGVGKWPLRQVLKRYVPERLFDRPKTGFAMPIAEWLRGPLRDWAETMLSEHRLRDGGYFDVQTVRELWKQHLSGRKNGQGALWGVLMFECWRDAWL